MSNKGISIMIQQESDGWHVIVLIDDALVEKSPPLPDRDTAIEKAKIVGERFETQFNNVGGNWRRGR